MSNPERPTPEDIEKDFSGQGDGIETEPRFPGGEDDATELEDETV